MIKNKRGVSNLVLVVLIIFISILAILMVYMVIIPLIKESSKNIKIDNLNNNIGLIEDSIKYNETLSLLEFSANRYGEGNISQIQVIIISNRGSLTFSISEIPQRLESRTYILNTSGLEDVQEITIYPVFENGMSGTGEKKEIRIKGIINENLIVIQPIRNANSCISYYECSEYSKCTLNYDLNNFLTDELSLSSEQSRTCHDKNDCNQDLIERRICDDKAKVTLKKTTENGKDFVEVYDTDSKLISKLEFIAGEQNILNIELPI